MIVRRTFAAGALALSLLAAPALAQQPGYVAQTAAPAGGASQVVKIKQGALNGSVTDGVAYHLGIPYAAPPVGDLRWKPPLPAAGWDGERDATQAGPVCQRNEDCLTINVVRPAGAKPNAKLPVMVWIHGGAYVTGTSMGAFGGDTEGTEFARKGIVHVSLNYRLGRAGWFAHPALSKEGPTGNYGMMDQIAALKWVQANVASFGGDPKNVTIYGESAGGISVLYLMLSPDAKGLFSKVIGESSFGRHLPTPLRDAEATGAKVAEAAGVTGDDAAAAAALRKLPLTAIAPTGGISAPGRPSPILDGRYIVSGITQGFAADRQAKVPLMLGGNSHEASLFRPQPALLDLMPEERRANVLKVFDPQGTGDKARIVNDLSTVQSMTEPDRHIARLHTKAGQPAFLYYFSYVPPSEQARKPYGAAHTDEIRFVFVSPKARLTPEDLPLAQAMNSYWANFAKTGNPGAVAGVTWPRFDATREGQIDFTAEGPKVREHHLKAWRDAVDATQPK